MSWNKYTQSFTSDNERCLRIMNRYLNKQIKGNTNRRINKVHEFNKNPKVYQVTVEFIFTSEIRPPWSL